MTRDFSAELDGLKAQMEELKALVLQGMGGGPGRRTVLGAGAAAVEGVQKQQAGAGGTQEQQAAAGGVQEQSAGASAESAGWSEERSGGELYYSGRYRGSRAQYRWDPQTKEVGALLGLDGERAARVLAALGHRQRLDILRTVLQTPLTGAELVEQLGMGTTGQLYHHLKALIGAGLLQQEERGGAYTLPGDRALPLLLLLAAVSDLAETSAYLDMSEVRSEAGAYLGEDAGGHDPHLLLWALLENAILEHRAGYGREIHLFLHSGGGVTVSDQGRGIPVHALRECEPPNVQRVLTDIRREGLSADYRVPGGEKGISVAVINALSHRLTVEVRREGRVFRQEYRHGIPQTGLLTVGSTEETGTSITFEPDRDLFRQPLEAGRIRQRAAEIESVCPGLTMRVFEG